MSSSARDLVDTDRYPIDTQTDARNQLVARCRAQLDTGAICCLPGFIRQERLVDFIDEMDTYESSALYNDHLSTPYAWMDNSGFAPGHPRSTVFRRRFSYTLTDAIQDSGPIRSLFNWNPLTDFVRDALGFETLYQSACPTLSIQLNMMHEGDVLPWHFDTNDGVVSLLLQQADHGGQFQVAPYVRDEDDEHYENILRVFNEDPELIVEPGMPPGTFILFKGRRSIHRVSPVGPTSRPRTIVLYSFDEQPGMVFTEKSRQRMRNPDGKPYLGAGTPDGAPGFVEWSQKTPG